MVFLPGKVVPEECNEKRFNEEGEGEDLIFRGVWKDAGWKGE